LSPNITLSSEESMSLETEVAALTTATTNLLSAVNVSKSTLDQAVSDATDQVQAATDQVGLATTQAGIATTQAGIATTKAGEASGSAASALAIYGNTTALNTAVQTATSQANLAAGYAASAGSVLSQDVSAVSANLHSSPNATTALFVYDTSKDSDGGAWTEKCQHTSWFTETIYGKWLGAQVSEAAARLVSGATTDAFFQMTTDGKFYKLNASSGTTEVFRGNKRAFPKIAAIVAEASSVTIYDLTEPGRPMWMRFTAVATATVTSKTLLSGAHALAAVNGKLYVGGAGTNLTGLTTIDFAVGKATLRLTSGYTWGGLISSRNTAGGYTAVDASVGGLIHATANSVAATVLPDAPVDPVTGLKIPTVAVATGGGISIVQNSGVVRNSSSTSSFTLITLTPQLLSAGRGDQIWYTAAAPGSLGASFSVTQKAASTAVDFNIGNTSLLRAKDRSNYARSSSAALLNLIRNNEAAATKGLSAKITDTFNTGWMVGDIRRAFLSDVGAGNATGTITDRSYRAGSATITGTLTKAVVAANAQLVAYSNFSGANYIRETYNSDMDFGASEFSVSAWVNIPANNATAGTILSRASATAAELSLSINASNQLVASVSDSTTTRTVTTSASYNTAMWLKVRVSYTVDGKLAILVNGVEVASATGSPLLSLTYRYNLANYSEQFTAASWSKFALTVTANSTVAPDSTSTADTLTASAGAANHRLSQATTVNSGVVRTGSVYLKKGTANYAFVTLSGTNALAWASAILDMTTGLITQTSNGTQASSVASSVTDEGGGWYRLSVSCVYSPDTMCSLQVALSDTGTPSLGGYGLYSFTAAGTETVYAWGAQLETGGTAKTYQRVAAAAETLGPVLTLGNNFALDAPFPGSLALVKLSATVPTAEQTAWVFEQEKQLFRDGAQCVLPASTNVLGLFFDDVTDTWSVVQAANESVWSGLVRASTQVPSAGSFSRVAVGSGIKLLGRSVTNPGVDVQIPAKNLRPKDMPRDTNQDIVVFDFDSVTSQTDFVLPVGYTARVVYSAGVQRREGATWSRLYDGFKESVRFAVAPDNGTWVQVHAVKEV
jgi:hypothetical protein